MNATEEKKQEAPLSRLGRKPIDTPAGVKLAVANGVVNAEGPKGKSSWTPPLGITVEVKGPQVFVKVDSSINHSKAMHGMSRKLVLNMLEGVFKGFQKRLIIEGVGYRAQVAGETLNLTLGFSHPVAFKIPKGIVIKSDPKTPNILAIEGNDKQKVGVVAAQIRSIRPPEPYKGTGIRYDYEIIKRKAGKAAVGAAGGAGKK